jgi:hypothetical protein
MMHVAGEIERHAIASPYAKLHALSIFSIALFVIWEAAACLASQSTSLHLINGSVHAMFMSSVHLTPELFAQQHECVR